MRGRALVVVGVAGLAVLAACGSSDPKGVTSPTSLRPAVAHGQLEVDGRVRTYRVFAPATVDDDGPVPVVLALHGSFADAESFSQATQLDRAAMAGDFVVAYPETVGVTWNGGFCCGVAPQEGIDDVAFLTSLLDELASTYPVDPDRVYAVGASAGGIMAYRLGCERAERITGVAAIGGAMVMDGCNPSRPVSVLAIHGTADGEVPFGGGPTSGSPVPVPAQPALAEAWANLDGCGDEPRTEVRGVVRTSTWVECRAGRSVRLVAVEGGGHTWFASEFGEVAGAVDATEAITEFFALGA